MLEKNQKHFKVYEKDMTLTEKVAIPIQDRGFALSMTMNEKKQELLVSTSTKQLICYQASKRKGFEVVRRVDTEEIQTQLWHLPKHQVYVSTDKRNCINQWHVTDDLMYIEFFSEACSEEVVSLVEIEYPISIAYASMDKTITLYSLKDRQLIRKVRDNKTSLKQLCYSPHFGAYMISLSNEIFMRVYSPET